jgi:A nuclease family of the HNH/ENDO VII superfamily with conserved AHH
MSAARQALSAFMVVVLTTSCGTSFEEIRPDPPPVARSAPAPRATAPAAEVVLVPRVPGRPLVPVTEAELVEFARETMRPFQVVPAAGSEPLDVARLEMVAQYERWCALNHRPPDCAGALQGKQYLDQLGKYRVAFDIALGERWSGFTTELRDMVNVTTLVVFLVATMVTYMAMIALPTGVTQLAAAAFTMLLTAYLGAETLWNLVVGWKDMVMEVNAAKTFDQVYAAGKKYGLRIGAQIARILIMAIMAAVAEGGMVARLLDIPEEIQASRGLFSDSGGKVSLEQLGEVRGAQVGEQGVTLVLAPAGVVAQGAAAVAMAVRGTPASGKAKGDCDEEPRKHHIFTDKNDKSDVRGGPWTPLFEKEFKRAGMTLDDQANLVEVQGHKGPHPEEYHQIVYEELTRALGTCRTTVDCRRRLVTALRELANRIKTPGSNLNRLVTRGCGG